MDAYDVTVTRDGRWWMIEIPEIDGLTQARRLADVADMARSYIAVDQDVSPSSFRINLVGVQVADVDASASMNEVARLRSEAAIAEERAGEVMRKTAWRLTEEGVSARDIGYILGVSHQRVSQLVNS